MVNVLKTQLDLLLGFPDFCWSWYGPGIFRELLKTSFCDRLVLNGLIKLYIVEMIPLEKWNKQKLALIMGRHRRLGACAAIGMIDSEILRQILDLVICQ